MNISKNLLPVAALLLFTVSSSQVSAQEIADTDTSQVSVSFELDPTPLKIDSVSDLVFGNHPVTAAKATVTAELALNLSLIDNRGFHVSDGWTLTAAFSGFTHAETAAASLGGAYITLDSNTASGESESLVRPQLTKPVTLQSNGSVNTVAIANRPLTGESTGVGTWTISSETLADISLITLENTVSPGSHTAEVIRTLNDVPQ